MQIFHKTFITSGISSEVKSEKSFRGKIDFSDFIELFNFESNIYSDKQFGYSLISNYNKRLIPEFTSAALAKLIIDKVVNSKIARNLEHYQIALLSNIDYEEYATLSQLKKILDDQKNHISEYHSFVLGSSPKNFSIDEKMEILIERIKISKTVKDSLGDKIISNTKILINQNIATEKSKYKTKIVPLISDNKLQVIQTNEAKSKLTKSELTTIFDYIELINKNNEPYNLVLFASTYHLSKIANEIEKYFYDNVNVSSPQNIIIIGTEKCYDLIRGKNIADETESSTSLNRSLHLKKLQSFLFEIFMHSLDRNRQK